MPRVLGATVAALAVAHAGPSLAAVAPWRRHLMPGLAGVGNPRHVALTFDGGPDPASTPRLLRLLHAAGVRATFFLLGRAAEENPEITRAVVAAGHEVGVQAYESGLLLGRGARGARADLGRATWAVAAVTGITPRWWRPPHGVPTTATMREARRRGLRPVLWTSAGHGCTANLVYREVMRGLDGGGTMMLSDSGAALTALPAILRTCRARGLTVGPLRDHGLLPTPPAAVELISR
jgi:peptidoglycan/xylan/chitin deacetylase (PgdA/CDA1 family)